jgi:hypothetical protein
MWRTKSNSGKSAYRHGAEGDRPSPPPLARYTDDCLPSPIEVTDLWDSVAPLRPVEP